MLVILLVIYLIFEGKKFKNIIIGHLNVNSIRNKIEDIRLIFQDNIDVIALSETKLDETFTTAQFNIKGFRAPFRKDKNARSGGLLVYVNENIPCKLLSKHISPLDIQSIIFELNLRKQKWLIISIYRPPNQSKKYFLDSISNIIDQYNSSYDKIICLGDFNVTTNDTDMKAFLVILA